MTENRLRSIVVAAAIALVISACAGTDDQAGTESSTPPTGTPAQQPAVDEVAEFYRGNTIRIVVGFSPGGGYDTQARLIAGYLGQYIPGNPTVLVQNLPGAGSALAANQIYVTFPLDGTYIGYSNGRILSAQVLGAPGSVFETSELEFIGQMSSEQSACFVRTDRGITSLKDIIGAGRPLFFGGLGPGGNVEDIPATVKSVLEIEEIEIVSGYPGFADAVLALEQGGIDGLCGGYEPSLITIKPLLDSGTVFPIAFAGTAPHPDWPNAELFSDLATTDEQRRFLDIALNGPDLYPRPLYLGTGVPQARIEALRTAFWAVMQDPAFIEAATAAGAPYSPLEGAALQEAIRTNVVDMPAEVADLLRPIQLPARK